MRLRRIPALFLSSLVLLLASSCTRRIREAPVPPAQPRQFGPKAQEHEEDSPREAVEFFLKQRAPDQENLPVGRLLAAKDHVKRMKHFSIAQNRSMPRPIRKDDDDGGGTTTTAPPTPVPGTWTSLGPSNVGGLTRAFVINPQNPLIMYAGASGGGVWQTIDGGQTWAPLGDFLPTISVQSLAIDPANPNTLYAGTGDTIGGELGIRGVGIFQSLDAGQTWNLLPGTVNSSDFYYVYSIVVSPNNSNNIYAGTWTGVWMSTDGGNSFTQTLPRPLPNSGCEELAIRTDQTSTDYLFAACGRYNIPKTAVFRNIDAVNGAPWENVLSVPGMGRTSLALAPSNQGRIYALLSDLTPNTPANQGMLGLYRSDSNGDAGSWQLTASRLDANRVNGSLLSYPGKVFADVCSGGTPSYAGIGFHANVLTVDPTNQDRLWAGSVDIFRSDDGGANWGIAMFWETNAPTGAHADNHRLVFHPKYDGDTNQVLYNTSDGGIYMTSNANAPTATGPAAGCAPYSTQVAWTNLNSGYSVTQFYDGTVAPGANQYLAGAQDNGTRWGRDALGTTWSSYDGGDGGFVLINPQNPNEIYSNFTYLSLVRSTDGGISQEYVTEGITEPSSNFLFIVPVVMDPSAPQRLYLGGQALWRTDDRGDHWTQSTTIGPSSQGQISAIAVSPLDSNTVLYGTSGGEIFSTNQALTADQTVTWNMTQPRSSGFVARIAFDPTGVNTAYAVYSTYANPGQNYVYVTHDGAATWTPIDGSGDGALPDAPVLSIVIDPTNNQTLYAGTELGVFTSPDGGNTWMADVNDFANVPITKLVLDRSAGVANLIAFTYGRGVWKTAIPVDGGTQCQYALDNSAFSMSAYGEPASVNIQTAAGCGWTVSTNSGFLYVTSPATGIGPGPAQLYADWNVSTKARSGGMIVGNQQVTITQGAAVVAPNNNTTPAPIAAVPYVGYLDSRQDTLDANDPVHSCTQSQDFKTVWWTFTAPVSGTLNVAAEGRRYDANGNSGVVLTVYDTQPTAAQELTCVIHPRDKNAWTPVATSVTVTQGRTYRIEISATGNSAADGGETILAVAMK